MDTGGQEADGRAEAADDGPEPTADEPEAHVQGEAQACIMVSASRLVLVLNN